MSHTKNFSLLVLGQIISLFGNAILRFALPLCLLRETNSAIIYSSITSFAMLPLLIGYLIGGTHDSFYITGLRFSLCHSGIISASCTSQPSAFIKKRKIDDWQRHYTVC